MNLGTLGLKPGLINFYCMDYVNQCTLLDYSIFQPTSTWFGHEETISNSRRIFHSNLIIFICWFSIDITSTFPIIFALPHAQHSLFFANLDKKKKKQIVLFSSFGYLKVLKLLKLSFLTFSLKIIYLSYYVPRYIYFVTFLFNVLMISR